MPIREGELETVLEKLPAMLKDSGVLYHQSPTGFQEHFNRRQTNAINEWEEKNKETFNQNKNYPSRKYNNSTRKNSTFDPEPDSMLVKKVNGVDRGFPLKPVYHKRFFGDKDEVQIFPVPSVPPLSGRVREHSGEPRTENRKRQEKSSPSFEDYNHSQDGSQERLPDEQRRIAKDIRKKQIWIQNQLWQTGERLKVQRERVSSGEDTRRREEERDTRRTAGDRYMSEEHRRRHGERGGQARINNESLRREDTLEWPREERKERNKGRRAEETPMEDWEGGGGRDKETSKSGERSMHHQERETQRERERGVYQERETQRERERGVYQERETDRERGVYQERETQRERERGVYQERETQRERERSVYQERETQRVRERGVYQERETQRDRERSARLKERERREVERDINDKVMRLEREKKLMWDVWERERARAEEERSKLAKEKLDWQREKQREGVRDGVRDGVREGLRDGKRREQVLAPREKIQEIVQQKPCHRGTGSSQLNGRRSSPESSNTSVSNPPSVRLEEDDLYLAETCDEIPVLLPCKICQRHFLAERLDKHHKICEKKSNRKVYDSSKHRAKGTALEEFMKTNSRSKTPELKKKIWRVNAAGGPAQLEVQDPNHVTCPHCGRRFAPGPAERHIPKCQNIKSRPPPPPRHR